MRDPSRPARRGLRPDPGRGRPLRHQRHGLHARPAGGHPGHPAHRAALHRRGDLPAGRAGGRRAGPAARHVAGGALPRRLRRRGCGAHPVPLLRGDRPDAGRDRTGLRDDGAGLHRAVRVAGPPREGAQPAVARPAAVAVRAGPRRRGVAGRRVAGPDRRGGGADRGALPRRVLPAGRARHRHARPGGAHLLELRVRRALLGGGGAVVAVRRERAHRAGAGVDRLGRGAALGAGGLDRRPRRDRAVLAVDRRAPAPGADRRRAGGHRRARVRLDRRLAVARAGAHRLAGGGRASSSSPGSSWRRPHARRRCRRPSPRRRHRSPLR